jgi:hypothetical protein
MTNQSNQQQNAKQLVVRRCISLRTAFEQGDATLDEYVDNLLLTMARADEEELQGCIASIPQQSLRQVFTAIENYLVPVDFMPNPLPLLVLPCEPQRVLEFQTALKPRYQQIYSLLVCRLQELEA